jgi:hypothetical protein
MNNIVKASIKSRFRQKFEDFGEEEINHILNQEEIFDSDDDNWGFNKENDAAIKEYNNLNYDIALSKKINKKLKSTLIEEE